jgi:hypothetical protein
MKSFYEFYQKMLSEQPAPQQATQAPAAGAQQQQPPAGQQQQQKPQGGATSPPIPDKATQTILDTLKANANKVADPKMKKTLGDLLKTMEQPTPGAAGQQPAAPQVAQAAPQQPPAAQAQAAPAGQAAAQK